MQLTDPSKLAVVVASILQHRSSLGLGNVIGSSISNILGAFSLGLLFHPGPMTFDRSAKIYTSVLFLVTTVFTVIALTNHLDRVAGIVFLITFAVHLASIGYGIYKDVLAAPEDDEDSDSDSESGAYDEEEGSGSHRMETAPFLQSNDPPVSSTPNTTPNGTTTPPSKLPVHYPSYYIFRIILGFIALSLSGYVLSHAASSLAIAFNLSGTVLGITILAFATTLPKKLLSVLSGVREHGGIIIVSTAGSNIFLLTLCLGVIFVTVGEGRGRSGGGELETLRDTMVAFEIWVAWISSAIFLGIVFAGGKRWMGMVLLGLYFTFIGLEFTMFRR
jgi:Ca2+/Na+ antiporter